MTQHAPIESNVNRNGDVVIFDVHGRLTIGDSSDQLTAGVRSFSAMPAACRLGSVSPSC